MTKEEKLMMVADTLATISEGKIIIGKKAGEEHMTVEKLEGMMPLTAGYYALEASIELIAEALVNDMKDLFDLDRKEVLAHGIADMFEKGLVEIINAKLAKNGEAVG